MKKFVLCFVALVFALAPAAQAESFTDNFDTPHNYLTDGLGAYDGLLDGDGTVTTNSLDASTNRAGELYIQNDAPTGGWSGDSTGQLLYKEFTGDFVATVKVTDFAGTLDERVFHNSCGILARDPAGGTGTQNWVSMNYFPTWVSFIAWNNIDSARTEHGQVAQHWAGDDTFAIAEANPWIQLERVGDDFHFRISADGVTFHALTDPAYDGIPDGTQLPLVLNRPDLPATLQIGLVQDGTNGIAEDQMNGYAAFDNFSIAPVPEPSTLALLLAGLIGLAVYARRRK